MSEIYQDEGMFPVSVGFGSLNRNLLIPLSGMWHLSIESPKTGKIFGRSNFKSFALANYISFCDVSQCIPSNHIKRSLKMINSKFKDSNSNSICNQNYVINYGKTSFQRIFFTKDLVHNEYLSNAAIMGVSLDIKTKKPAPVDSFLKDLINKNRKDQTYLNVYKQKSDNILKKLQDGIPKMNALRENWNINNKIYQYKMQPRFLDEDPNRHLNQFSYPKYIEECLMKHNKNIRNGKYGIFSINIIYWKEISVSKFNWIYVHFWKKIDIKMISNVDGKTYVGFDIYGTFDTNDACKVDINKNDNNNDTWTHHTGFIVRIIKGVDKSKL